MPKTVEELEKYIVELKAENAGRVDTLKKELDTATAHSVKLTKDNEVLIKEVAGSRKAKRDDLEAQGHAINKEKDFKDYTNEALFAYIDGSKDEAKNLALNHSLNGQTQTPPANAGTQTPPVDRAKLYLDS